MRLQQIKGEKTHKFKFKTTITVSHSIGIKLTVDSISTHPWQRHFKMMLGSSHLKTLRISCVMPYTIP